jgi:hypothetical protein
MPNTPSMDTSGSAVAYPDNILELNSSSRISSSPLSTTSMKGASLQSLSAAMMNGIMHQKLSPSSVSTISSVGYDSIGCDYLDSTVSPNVNSSRPNTPKLPPGIPTNGCDIHTSPLPSPATTTGSGGSSRNAVQITWNKAITSASNVSDITDLMYMYGNQFNAVNIATSLHRLASQFRFDVRRYADAIRIVLDRARDTNFDGFSPRELANVVWAMAKTEMPCKEDVFDHVSRKAISSFSDSDYTPQAIANLLWGMAKAGYPNELLFDHLSNIAIRSGLNGFNAQNLSNSLWALSTAQLPNFELFDMIGNFIVEQHNNLKGFSPQNMANAVWAMAKVNMPHIELFDLISTKATESRFSGFKPQEIANLVWAMSTCRLTKIQLILQVFTEIKNFSEWKTQEISNLVWAVAIGRDLYVQERSSEGAVPPSVVERKAAEFLNIVFDEIDKRGLYSGWKPTELSNLTLGLCKLSESANVKSRFDKLLSQLSAKIKRENGFFDYKLNELLNIVSLLIEAKLVDPEMLNLILHKLDELYGPNPPHM